MFWSEKKCFSETPYSSPWEGDKQVWGEDPQRQEKPERHWLGFDEPVQQDYDFSHCQFSINTRI